MSSSVIATSSNLFEFLEPESAFFSSAHPQLAAAVSFGRISRINAMQKANQMLIAHIRNRMKGRAGLSFQDAPEIASECVLRLARSGKGNQFDPMVANAWALINKFLLFIFLDSAKKERRNICETRLHAPVEAPGCGPCEAASDREYLHLAAQEYKKLSGSRQFAMRRMYPFLPLIKEGVSNHVDVDRHRAIHCITMALNLK
jgi:hypothetical protein